jgi:hypothetical protein
MHLKERIKSYCNYKLIKSGDYYGMSGLRAQQDR